MSADMSWGYAERLVKAAKHHRDEIADCTCADSDEGGCWYYLSDDEKACTSVWYALRTVDPYDHPFEGSAPECDHESQFFDNRWRCLRCGETLPPSSPEGSAQ